MTSLKIGLSGNTAPMASSWPLLGLELRRGQWFLGWLAGPSWVPTPSVCGHWCWFSFMITFVLLVFAKWISILLYSLGNMENQRRQHNFSCSQFTLLMHITCPVAFSLHPIFTLLQSQFHHRCSTETATSRVRQSCFRTCPSLGPPPPPLLGGLMT